MDKYNKLYEYLNKFEKVAIGFSGGVDSSLLIRAAVESLGKKNVIAVTILSSLFSQQEREEALNIAKIVGVRHIVHSLDVFSIPNFKQNPIDRCYICKTRIFETIKEIAKSNGINVVLDGTNSDDEGDYRPGMKALKELGIISPLKECGLGKIDIRKMSRDNDLVTWDRPSLACLASRIPYNEQITEEKLRKIEKAEDILRTFGFTQFRVRFHDTIARIELTKEEMPKIFKDNTANFVVSSIKKVGFTYVTLDLSGYRTGSLNETILKEEK